MESVRLTLGDLTIIRRWYERMPKRKQVLEQRITSWYHQKSAEVVVIRRRVPGSGEVSHKDEGLNVRIGRVIRTFMLQATTTETHQRATCARISRKLKVNHRRS
jgi:hypothetical protein